VMEVRELAEATVARHKLADKTKGGKATMGKKQDQLEEKQAHEAALHGAVGKWEHEIRVRRDRETELRLELTRCKRILKFEPLHGKLHVEQAAKDYAEIQVKVSEAIEELTQAEEAVRLLWEIPQEEMGRDLMRANQELRTTRHQVSRFNKELRTHERDLDRAKTLREEQEMEVEQLEIATETERIAANVRKDTLEMELRKGEAKVKASRLLERDLDQIVKTAEQAEELYQKWRTRSNRGDRSQGLTSNKIAEQRRARSVMDDHSASPKDELVLPRIGAASAMG